VTGAPRGYAFIEYDTARDAENAVQRAHRMMLDGQQLIVDMERERTMPGWVPRRKGNVCCAQLERAGCRRCASTDATGTRRWNGRP